MLTPQLLKRIQQIELRSRRLVQNAFAGSYHSIYKGRGLSFAAVRPYVPGDDVRAIDWKVTARTGQPFIKEFVEERELTLMLLIDGSASLFFGTQDRQKREFAAELGAVLAYAASHNNDKAGLMIFSSELEHYIPPRKGRKHIMRLIRDVLTFQPQHSGTDLSQVLRKANRVLTSGAILFIISDFLLLPDSYRRDLYLTGQNHETIAVIIRDPLEEQIPRVGLMGVRDAETGATQWVDTRSLQWQQQFRQQRDTLAAERDQLFRQAGVETIDMPPDGDYVRALRLFFQQQMRKRWR